MVKNTPPNQCNKNKHKLQLSIMVQLEMLIRNIIARILLRLGKITKALKLIYFSNKLNSFAKKIDIIIYNDYDFLQYVKDKSCGFTENSHNIETVALCSSTADYGFHPNYFPNSYNSGLISSDLQFTYLHYKSIAKNNHLKNIIVFFSLFTVGYNLSKTKERNRLIAYYESFNIQKPNEQKFKRRYSKHIAKRLNNINFSKLKNYCGYENRPLAAYGEEDVKNRIKTHTRENKRTPDQLLWLEKLDQETMKNGHNLFIVLAPFRKDYKNGMPSFQEGYKKFFELKLNNSKIINFHNDESYTDDCFYDTDHLNEKGAIKLTKELYSIMNEV